MARGASLQVVCSFVANTMGGGREEKDLKGGEDKNEFRSSTRAKNGEEGKGGRAWTCYMWVGSS